MLGVGGIRGGVGIEDGYMIRCRNCAKRAARPRRPGVGTSLVVTGAIKPIPLSQPQKKERGIGLLAPWTDREKRGRRDWTG